MSIRTSNWDGNFGAVEANGDDGMEPSQQEIDQRRVDDRAGAKTRLTDVLQVKCLRQSGVLPVKDLREQLDMILVRPTIVQYPPEANALLRQGLQLHSN